MAKRNPDIKLRLDNITIANGIAKIKCPTPWRYKNITFILGDSGAANANAPALNAVVNEITVDYARTTPRRLDATALDQIQTDYGAQWASQAYAGVANGSGRRHFTMNFCEGWRKRSYDQDALGWQTGWFTPADKFEIKLGLVAGITPVVEAIATVDDFNGGAPHAIMHYDQYDVPFVGTVLPFKDLLDADGALSQVSIFDTSDAKTIEQVKLFNGRGNPIFDRKKQENLTELKSYADMTQAAGRFHMVFDPDDDLQSCIPARDGYKLEITASAAANGTVRLVSQRLWTPKPGSAAV